jgi:hypothetical protein
LAIRGHRFDLNQHECLLPVLQRVKGEGKNEDGRMIKSLSALVEVSDALEIKRAQDYQRENNNSWY